MLANRPAKATVFDSDQILPRPVIGHRGQRHPKGQDHALR